MNHYDNNIFCGFLGVSPSRDGLFQIDNGSLDGPLDGPLDDPLDATRDELLDDGSLEEYGPLDERSKYISVLKCWPNALSICT